MTGLEADLFAPRDSGSPPRDSIDQGEAEVNRNSLGGNPESQGANRSAY